MVVQYTEDDIEQAIQSIANGDSLRKAALEWGIPRTTLQGRLHGSESREEAFAGQQWLSRVQEMHLAQWILTQSALGLPPTHVQIKQFAQHVLATKGDHKLLGKTLDASIPQE